MRILSRYFAARFLGYFAAILFTSTLIIATIEMLLNFDDMLKAGGGVAGILTYLFLRIPSYYLRDLIPIATFLAAFVTYGVAARWMESTAIKAGGISPFRIVVPVLVGCAAVAAFAFVVNETVVLRATRQWSQLERGDDTIVSFRQGSFWYHSGRTIYNIREANRENRTLRGVRIFERDAQGRLVSRMEAHRVQIEDPQHWFFERATIYHFEPDDPSRPTRVEHARDLRQPIADTGDAALLAADSGTLSIGKILEYIAARPSSERVRRLQADLHARLADPFVPLLFVLLAIPLGLRVEATRSFASPAVQGVLTVGAFYLVRGTSTTLATEGALPVAAAPWCVVALFAAWGTFRLARIPR